MKLAIVYLPEDAPKALSELRLPRTFKLAEPVEAIRKWRVLLRGPALFLVSPAGDAVEFARSRCTLSWSGVLDTAVLKDVANYTSEPMERDRKGEETKP